MPKLTKTTVESEQPGDKERFIWDTEIKGFGLKIFPTGAKTFSFSIGHPKAEPAAIPSGNIPTRLPQIRHAKGQRITPMRFMRARTRWAKRKRAAMP